MARLHGFPDWFRFHSTKWHGARQIGNSVPPPLGRAIAGMVLAAIDAVPTRPNQITALGEEGLLYMEMTEAADFFEVRAPLGRRTQKSGARKRKQVEIEAARLAGLEAGGG
jgi:DNA (cytosine-5)-methyltransferase 1